MPMSDHIAASAPLSDPLPNARFCESATLDIPKNWKEVKSGPQLEMPHGAYLHLPFQP